MWIVRIALRRPYTFVVLALLILLVGPLTIARTPTDIFPNINIPVVTVVWNYGGLSADEMSNRIVSIYERNLTTTVTTGMSMLGKMSVGVRAIVSGPTIRMSRASTTKV